MSRHHYFYTPPRVPGERVPVRRGLTLIEILIAVSLMTIIMLAAVRVLTYVSHTLTKTQNAMVIAGRARTAQMQLERDLDCFTAPLTPPLRFSDAQGYVCIIEGQGSHYGNLEITKVGTKDIAHGWGSMALNSDVPGSIDSTVGDVDDILMFTARAPEGSMFRGLVGGKVMESKEAEICIFLRGTTLYRRVLLIIPNDQLQAELSKFPTMVDGKGFYRHFDVSARLDNTGRICANTLADLTRRENRFGHAIAPNTANPLPFPYGIHNNAAWYQLRLPTLAECTYADNGFLWQAGKQIVTSGSKYDKLNSQLKHVEDGTSCTNFPDSAGTPYIDFWENPLPWTKLSKNGSLAPSGTSDNVDIFIAGTDAYANFSARDNEDVLLTNVIGFDIKVWDTKNVMWNTNHWEQLSPGFVDLGHLGRNHGGDIGDPELIPSITGEDFRKSFVSQGFYGTTKHGNGDEACYSSTTDIKYALLPAVYDTWTDAYENDATGNVLDMSGNSIPGIGTLDGYTDIYTDIMEHVDQWRCPPPYNVPLTGLQIKIRVFDPNSNNIREVTIRKNFTQ